VADRETDSGNRTECGYGNIRCAAIEDEDDDEYEDEENAVTGTRRITLQSATVIF
jgi:hypothetical protein